MQRQPRKMAAFRLPVVTLEKLKVLADEDRRSMNSTVEIAIDTLHAQRKGLSDSKMLDK